MTSLALLLGRVYDDRVIHGVDRGAAKALKTALADPTMRHQAEARLGELGALAQVCGGDLARRCFVSARHKEFLEAALAS